MSAITEQDGRKREKEKWTENESGCVRILYPPTRAGLGMIVMSLVALASISQSSQVVHKERV